MCARAKKSSQQEFNEIFFRCEIEKKIELKIVEFYPMFDKNMDKKTSPATHTRTPITDIHFQYIEWGSI